MDKITLHKPKEIKTAYLNGVAASSSWGKPRVPSRHRKHIESELVDAGMSAEMATLALNVIFGCPATRERGAIQKMVDSGQRVHIDGFGQFGHRMRKEKITNDVSQPGTMIYTPACSTFDFKPDQSVYWDHYQASIAANMPSKPLPKNMHFSQRVMAMSFYQDWENRMQALCKDTDTSTSN